MGLQAKVSWQGGFWHAGPPDASGRIGQTAGLPAGAWTVSDGTGAGQANQVYCPSAGISVGAGSTLLIDLKGGGGELDVRNVALAMTAVKLVLLEVTTPGAGTSLRFGPQGQANAATLWYQANTANFWSEVRERLMQCDSQVGWALDATHKVLAINNPGASTVAATLLVIGTK